MTDRPARKGLALLIVVMLGVVTTGCNGHRGPTITVYSAAGLSDWYRSQFDRFTRATGITVTLFEAGAGEVVSRVNSGAVWDGLSEQKHAPPADLLVTYPPFIQKAAAAGLLQAGDVVSTGISTESAGPGGLYVPVAKTALCFIVNLSVDPRPVGWADLLDPRFRGKLQYSSPGDAGDGTAVLLLLQHLMGRQAALGYLTALQKNNVGPAPSAAILEPKVSSGELLVADGDVQMNLDAINEGANFEIFFPAMPDGTRTTVSLPYVAAVTAASRWPEEATRLLSFLLTEEAQTSLRTEAFGIPVRDISGGQAPAGAVTPEEFLREVKVWTPDWHAVLADLEGDIAAYQKAIR